MSTAAIDLSPKTHFYLSFGAFPASSLPPSGRSRKRREDPRSEAKAGVAAWATGFVLSLRHGVFCRRRLAVTDGATALRFNSSFRAVVPCGAKRGCGPCRGGCCATASPSGRGQLSRVFGRRGWSPCRLSRGPDVVCKFAGRLAFAFSGALGVRHGPKGGDASARQATD